MFRLVLMGIFLVRLVAAQIPSTKEAKMIILYVDCVKLSRRTSFVNCSKHFEDGRSTLSAAFALTEDVPKAELLINGSIYFDGGRKLDYRNSRIDWCKVTGAGGAAQKSGRNALSLLVRRILAASVNLPTKCPVEKNVTYALRDYYVEVGMFPSFILACNYTIHFAVLVGPEKLFRFRIDGVVCTTQEFCQIYM